MNEDNKYYVPKLSDFHVGYEYEKSDDENIQEWHTEIKNIDFEWLDIYIEDGRIRVPYLTQGQIKAEGWKVVGSTLCKDIFDLYIDKTTIMIYDYNGDCYFNGECKSINEFRYICKLLKI